VTVSDQESFAQRLLHWWDGHGRKDLPWQHPRTPYRVWVSEIMLQQTQVTTVIPYFERWMDSLPDVESLAAAPLDDVLSLWSGLGYYARARNLHRAAAQCVAQHGGELPAFAEELVRLPGIGLSTANAIVSQSTDRPAAVLDGNVRRVLARHAAIEGWTGRAAVQKVLWSEAEIRLPAERGADYTQAIMDLGAMVCTRSGPACGNCPVRSDCQALKRGIVDTLPSPKPAAKVRDKALYMLIMQDDEQKVLLEKRPPTGIWGGLWCLPEGECIESIEQRLGTRLKQLRTLPAFEHRLSHLRLSIRPVVVSPASADKVKSTSETDWFSPSRQGSLGLPKPVAMLLNRFNNGEIE
jgi:A/G-specific adenine glycosylase